ncbi:MAG: PolC-type DNA polymerase III [Tissierellales bacterium]|nr:PolC-type DNA polymerase III [Tissierellales bacterium]
MYFKYQDLDKFFPNNETLSQVGKVFVEKAILNIKKSSISISMITNPDFNEENINEIYKLFKNVFPDYTISFSFKNDIMYDDKFIEDYIVYKITNSIPSSNSWVDALKITEQEEIITLEFPNQVSLHSFNSNGLKKEIEEFLLSLAKKKLEIKVDDNDNCDTFFETQWSKEFELIKDIEITSKVKPVNVKSDKNRASRNKIFDNNLTSKTSDISDLDFSSGNVTIFGEIFDINYKDIKTNKKLISFYITDQTNSIQCKMFVQNEKVDELENVLIDGAHLFVNGDITFDNYTREMTLMIKSINSVNIAERKDTSTRKRVELHLHTNMSAMDGISSVKSLISRAIEWNHPAIAITDHGVVQAFPEASEFDKKIKIIYGVEAYMINDEKEIITNYDKNDSLNNFVVFDIETTGLSPRTDKITEIGAVKIKDGLIIDKYEQLINPGIPIPSNITSLTGITDEMVKDMPKIEDIMPEFLNFIGDSILVAHNASFDVSFIRETCNNMRVELKNAVLDTLELSRALFPNLKSHKLNVIAKFLDVELINHHRAVDDAKATADILIKMLDILKDKDILTPYQLNSTLKSKNINKNEVFHCIILAKNQQGLKELYKLISKSHLEYFYRKPRIPKSLIQKSKNNFLIGSACELGEVYKAFLTNKPFSEINEIIDFYDYIEIQPIDNNKHLVRDGIVKNVDELKEINKKIYNLAKSKNKLVVATGDVHFLDPKDEVYRRIIMYGQGFDDADEQPPLYFRTTDEMIKEFSYLGEAVAEEIVVTNTNLISDMVEYTKPIPDGTFPPKIEGADDELKKIAYERAFKIYGNPLPAIVEERLNRELNSIINNGYSVLYIIAQKLVSKSMQDGYLVGSRGSVGSSFVATMSGITEVNPLPPHYVCENCHYSEFYDDGKIASGFDLNDKDCPNCGNTMKKDGHDIPFEVFLGFEGDKEPDIDLNFAGEYQSIAHKYTEELFGEGKVFRAGTIGTIADKTAYGFVKKYFEQKNKPVNQAEINRLVKGCTGIKRTSGQHPGGVMIVPDYKDIHDFTPIQYPADDNSSGVITTHFDYHSISGRILKLDILGHDVPTIIKMLEDLTGIDPLQIPLDDKDTMSLFTSTKALNIDPKEINCEVGTLGIPEFGTKFVRQMLLETSPTTFSELVRISGLSHGTDVWVNNAQDLVRKNIATLKEVISTREDIMLYLINAGLDKKRAFFTMEKVRKGKGLSQEDQETMRKLNIPEWYIESCNKIKYMFPKAHAAAYVTMSFRIAYFKVHYPQAFYATYFTTKASDFDAELILQGKEYVKSKIQEIENRINESSAKEKNQLTILEVALEMYARGLTFERVDLYKSDSDRFLIGQNGIIPPLKTLEGIGENAARKLVEERNLAPFLSIEELITRGKATRPVIEALEKHGCLKDIPETNQISLFNI